MANEGQAQQAGTDAIKLRKFYTPEQLAEMLSLEIGTVYRLLRAGKLPGAKIGNQWRTLGADLLAYYEEQKARAAERREDARSSG